MEHPFYTQLAFALQRLADLAPQHPEWQAKEPYKSALAGDLAAFAKFTMSDLGKLVAATHAGMTTRGFQTIVADWIGKAKHPRWGHLYPDLVYQPMLEFMQYLRPSRYKVYIVTGGGQAFVRAYAEQVYSSQPEEVIGSSLTPRSSNTMLAVRRF